MGLRAGLHPQQGSAGLHAFDTPQYLLVNLAIGGMWGGQKGMDDGSFPQRYLIDYVRIYRQ